jgi:hypothetical protein
MTTQPKKCDLVVTRVFEAKRYLKGAIEFRGVGIPQIRSVLTDWVR